MNEQLALGFGPREDFTADGFIASPCNADARAAIDAWQGWPGQVMALVGAPGTGKTHLAAIWRERTGAAMLDARRLGEALESLASGTPVLVENPDRGVDEHGLFHLINRAGQGSIPGVLLTARRPPAAWGRAPPPAAAAC